MRGWFFLALVLALIAICIWGGRWREGVRIAAAIGFMILSPGLFLLFEHFYYTPSRLTPLTLPLALDRVGTVQSPVFRTAFDDLFYVNLLTDPIGPRISCLTGEYPDILKVLQCGGHDPELNLAWTVRDGGRIAGSGGIDIAAWRRIATAPTPNELDLVKHGYPRLPVGAPDSRATPNITQLGWFWAARDRDYRLTLTLAASAPTLAKLHPRLEITLNPMVGKGAGPAFLFSLLLSFLGSIAILSAALFHRPREAQA